MSAKGVSAHSSGDPRTGRAVTLTPVRTQPISIEGVKGGVVVATNWKGGVVVYVDDKEVPARGKDRWALPAVRGADLEGYLQIKFWQVFPTLVVNSVEHRTGPKTPIPLIILAGLPLLMVLPVFGWNGIILGVATTLLNQSALRESTNLGVRLARLLVQDVVAIGMLLILPGL
jgi:hypothetical protein